VHKHGLYRREVLSLWLSVTFVYYVETAKDTAVVATLCEYKTAPELSNGTIFTDIELP